MVTMGLGKTEKYPRKRFFFLQGTPACVNKNYEQQNFVSFVFVSFVFCIVSLFQNVDFQNFFQLSSLIALIIFKMNSVIGLSTV